MGRRFAIELFAVLVVVELILYRSIREAIQSANARVLLRTIGSFACLVTEQLGAVALFLGAAWGLYVVGVGMMASFVFMVTGAWLLLVGVESAQAVRKLGSAEEAAGGSSVSHAEAGG